MELLLASESDMAQDWIVDCGGEDEVDPESHQEVVGDVLGTDERGQSSRTRQLVDEEFDSSNEEEVYAEAEYESDGVEIMDECGDKE